MGVKLKKFNKNSRLLDTFVR